MDLRSMPNSRARLLEAAEVPYIPRLIAWAEHCLWFHMISYDFMVSWSESFVFILAHTLDISWLHTVALPCLSSAGQQATESDALGFGEARQLEREREASEPCVTVVTTNYKSLGWPTTASVRQFTLPLTCCAIMMKLLHWAGMRYGMQPEQLSRVCTRE